jgi:hypothetical protein
MSTSLDIGSTSARDKPAAPASTGYETGALVHFVNPDEQDPRLVVVQTHRKALGTGTAETFGERMSLDEAARRSHLKQRPLTASDVPLVQWSEHLAQYLVRADGALVTKSAAVAWGHLDGAGGISWIVAPHVERG